MTIHTTDTRRIRVPGAFRAAELPDDVIYVGRAVFGYRRSPFANDHPVGKPCGRCGAVAHDLDEAVMAYVADLRGNPELVALIRDRIGTTTRVACWCRESEPCHGDVVLAVAHGANP